MTVKDLIEKLLEFDENYEVLVDPYDDLGVVYCNVEDVKKDVVDDNTYIIIGVKE